MSTASLKTAVQAFDADAAAAIATYGPIADWDVSAISDMSGLYSGLENFNADVSNWNTSGVTDMRFMFGGSDTGDAGATAFNQPLSFDTSSVTNMCGMFSGATAFNQPLHFDTSSVITMRCMFDGAWAFNQSLSVGVSNASGVLNSTVRRRALSSTGARGHFATSNVIDMGAMFRGARWRSTSRCDSTLPKSTT